jgi:hypothetical protein
VAAAAPAPARPALVINERRSMHFLQMIGCPARVGFLSARSSASMHAESG